MDLQYTIGANIAHELSSVLDEWQDSFNDSYAELLTDEAIAASAEPVEAAKVRDHVRTVHQSAPELFRAFLTLKISPELKKTAMDLSARLTPGEHGGGKRGHLLNLSEPFTDRLDIELAREFVAALKQVTGLTERGKKTWLTLMAAAGERTLGVKAAAYLSRPARLLLFGFDVECVAMCRAVLEAALSERLDPVELDRVGVSRSIKKPDGDDEFSLAGLIYGAGRLKVFTPEDQRIARTIKQDGNDVLHTNPGLAGEAHAHVYKLSQLLQKLYPYEGKEPELTW